MTLPARRPILALSEPGANREIPLPSWFQRMLDLGGTLARIPERPSERVIVALSVPALPLAAIGIAIGYSLETAPSISQLMQPDQVRSAAATLRHGEFVRLVNPGRVVIDRFYGESQPGRFQVGGMHFIADKIYRLERAPRWAQKASSHPIAALPAGLSSLLGRVDVQAFLTEGRSEIALVGTRTLLDRDLKYRFGLAERSLGLDLPEVAEVLRPVHVTGPVGWRSAVYPATSEGLPDQIGVAGIAILDGSTAVTQWIRDVSSPRVVAILDRSSRSAQSGALAVEQALGKGRARTLADLSIETSTACEATVFTDRR